MINDDHFFDDKWNAGDILIHPQMPDTMGV